MFEEYTKDNYYANFEALSYHYEVSAITATENM